MKRYQIDLKLALVSIIILLVFSACKTYKLSSEELSWNPYRIGQVLSFESSNQDVYNIKISSMDREVNRTNPYAGNLSSMHEQLIVRYKFEDNRDRAEHNLFTISKSPNNMGLLNFNWDLQEAVLLSDPVDIDIANRWNVERKVINGKAYNDVIEYKPVASPVSDVNFPYVTKLYWSKKKGYVQYQLSNGIVWSLKN